MTEQEQELEVKETGMEDLLIEESKEQNPEHITTPQERLDPKEMQAAIEKAFAEQEKEEKELTKVVYIKATPTFVVTPKEVEGEAYVIIGCPLKGKNVYIPLDAKEISEVATELFGFSTKDTDFVKQVRDYFESYRIRVEYSNNDVSAEEDGEKLVLPIDEEGKVVFKKSHVDDIIKYRICLQSKKVAVTPPEIAEARAPGESNYIAYLLDDNSQKLAERHMLELDRKASIAYLKITDKGKEKELAWVTRILMKGLDLGGGVRFIPSKVRGDASSLDDKDRQLVLSEFKTKHPKAFLEVVTDPNLEMRALIEQLIDIGVLTRTGNVIKYHEDVLGGDITSAIDELKKPSRSNFIVELKAAARI